MKKRNRFIAAAIAVITITVAVFSAISLSAATINMTAMTFESKYSSGAITTGSNYGNAVKNTSDATIDIGYASTTQWANIHYMAKPKFYFWSGTSLNSEHQWIRILYAADMPAGESCNVYLSNDSTGEKVYFDNKVTDTNGEYVLTDAKFLFNERNSIFNRFVTRNHNSLVFDTTNANCTFKIKALYFYASETDAYAVQLSSMTFEHGGTGEIEQGYNWGVNSRNYDDSTVDITYASSTNFGYNYMAKLNFASKADMNSSHKYVRVLYAADMPAGKTATMELKPDSGGTNLVFDDVISDTNGAYKLTGTKELTSTLLSRFSSGAWNSLVFTNTDSDSTFKIKALYFFEKASEADAFTYLSGSNNVTINGNDISLYQIVIADDASLQIQFVAKNLVSYLKDLTGIEVPVVTDKSPQTGYEILLGKSTRANSYEGVLTPINVGDTSLADGTEYREYAIKTVGNTLVLTTHLPHHITDCVNDFLANRLFKGYYAGIPATIALNNLNDTGIATSDALSYYYHHWTKPVNVANPEVFTDDFASDDGYFMEENNTDDFEIANGVLSADADDLALTYLHLYETNATFAADFTYNNAGADGDFGIMLRYNDALAWVKAGYDFEEGEWYIDSRDGMDFYRFRHASADATLTAGTKYTLELTVNGTSATLKVNGTAVATTSALSHLSPGRAAIFAEDVTLTVDNAELTMLSGQGEIMQNVTHNVLPTGKYTEGGSVLERADKTATYIHHSGYFYDSVDGGKTWVETNEWFAPDGYNNTIRLNNGALLQVGTSKDSYNYSQISYDDGKTWIPGGNICRTYYVDENGKSYTKISAGNVNDKLFQSPASSDYPNRIFYCQSYEDTSNAGIDGYIIFNEFFYSDDNGKTWIKSETSSLDMTFNGDAKVDKVDTFGECKIIEYIDENGNSVIRMYNTYNQYGCILYSDSFDGGKTFDTTLRELKDVNGESFPCVVSSFGIARDTYAGNDHTYYMVWVNNFDHTYFTNTRCGLSVAYSTDGATWTKLGEMWRWESSYSRTQPPINHIVDPFIQVTRDAVICGSGISNGILANDDGGESWHNGQRQHIYSMPKSLTEADSFSQSYSSNEYCTLAAGTQLVKIDAEEGNTVSYSYTLEDGTVVPFYYSSRYNAYVAVLPGNVTASDILNNIETENAPAEALAYDGDVNGDGKVSAGDAALVSAMLQNPNNNAYTAKMRLEADYLASGRFINNYDYIAILYKAVGLTYTPAN